MPRLLSGEPSPSLQQAGGLEAFAKPEFWAGSGVPLQETNKSQAGLAPAPAPLPPALAPTALRWDRRLLRNILFLAGGGGHRGGPRRGERLLPAPPPPPSLVLGHLLAFRPAHGAALGCSVGCRSWGGVVAVDHRSREESSVLGVGTGELRSGGTGWLGCEHPGGMHRPDRQRWLGRCCCC